MKTPALRFAPWVPVACLVAAPMFAATCESLTSLTLPDTTITMAQVVPAGAFSPPAPAQANAQAKAKGKGAAVIAYQDLPEFCRVAATLKPSSDSDIKVEFWLPVSGWNRKLQSVGNGGWAGVISYSAMADAVRAGYASASTDTGHVGRQRELRAGSSRKTDRLRVALRTRDDGKGESGDSGVLWQPAHAFVLVRVLYRRTAGP